MLPSSYMEVLTASPDARNPTPEPRRARRESCCCRGFGVAVRARAVQIARHPIPGVWISVFPRGKSGGVAAAMTGRA
jgi:hypothetical protein